MATVGVERGGLLEGGAELGGTQLGPRLCDAKAYGANRGGRAWVGVERPLWQQTRLWAVGQLEGVHSGPYVLLGGWRL